MVILPRVRPPADCTSYLGLLSNLKRIIDFYSVITHCTLQLGMSKQQLNGSEVLGTPVDQSGFGSSHHVGAKSDKIESNGVNP